MSATDTIDVAALVERLRWRERNAGTVYYAGINRLLAEDREIATALQSQAGDLATMREALEEIAATDLVARYRGMGSEPDRYEVGPCALIARRALGGSNAE